MSPRAFIATCLEASNGPFQKKNDGTIELTRRVIGAVSEGDAIVHVLFRVEGPGIVHTDPLSVEVVRLKRTEQAWNVDPTSFSFAIASIHPFTMLADPEGEEAGSDVEPGAPDA